MSENSKRVLIVEDQETNRVLLREYVTMSGGIPVDVSDGVSALTEIHAQPPDLVILDLRIPRLDGMSVLRHLRGNPDFNRLPIVVVSAVSELEKVSECIALGAIDFLPKPFKPQVLRSRIHNYLNRRQYIRVESSPEVLPREFAKQVVASLELMQSSASRSENWSDALFEVLSQYNPETRGHLDRVTAYCDALVRRLAATPKFTDQMGQTFVDYFIQTASLHDIGKLGVPDHILSKPGPLDPDEHRVMRRHVTVGAEILRELQVLFPEDRRLEFAIDLALYHHERWDGAGYPFGLSGENIPLAGRIMAVADVYDALTSERCYKSAFTHDQSREIIVSGVSKQFDPAVVNAFLECEEQFISISHHGSMPTDLQMLAEQTNSPKTSAKPRKKLIRSMHA